MNMTEIGARHNKYSSAFGSCIYYDKKCTLREKNGNMFDEVDIDNFVSPKKRNGNNDISNKFFGHFFDN